jgi:hypothetical protein
MVLVSASAYSLERLRIVMEPERDDPREAWGVLNPGAARGPDGELYLFPRLVAAGNYSRFGRARVLFDRGKPTGVERLGLALENGGPSPRRPLPRHEGPLPRRLYAPHHEPFTYPTLGNQPSPAARIAAQARRTSSSVVRSLPTASRIT